MDHAISLLPPAEMMFSLLSDSNSNASIEQSRVANNAKVSDGKFRHSRNQRRKTTGKQVMDCVCYMS